MSRLVGRALGMILAAAAVLPIASNAKAVRAASAQVGNVTITAGTGTVAYVWLGGTALTGSGTTCVPTSGWGDTVAFDYSTPKGKALLSLAQTALLTRKAILVHATSGGCTAIGGGVSVYTLDRLQYDN
jgi:hypothetical protein